MATATIIITGRPETPDFSSTEARGRWTVQPASPLADRHDVTFIDSATGWAVGASGTVLHTSNGGATWEPQDSGVDVKLTRASFVDRHRGWAVGNLGVIIHTSDGGKTWRRQGEASTLGFNLAGVPFVDERTGWVVTERGSLMLRTNDAGETWTPLFLTNTGPRSDAVFADGRRGWVVFSRGSLLYTSNSGETWQFQPGINRVHIGTAAAFFLDENNGWIAGWREKGTG